MYKCKECGAEYDIKPDYCDCGNDEFDKVIKEKTVQKTETVIIKPEPKRNSEEKQKKTYVAEKRSFEEQYPSLNRFIHSADPISTVIFCVCILLSAYVIFFAWNPKESDIKTETTQEVAVSKNIPPIDKFWNNAVPVVKRQEPEVKNEPKKEPVKTVVPAAVQTPKKVVKVPLIKNTTAKKNTTQKSVQKQTNTKQDQLKKQQEEAAKKKAEQARLVSEAAKKKAEQERLAAEAAQLKKLQQEQAKKAEAEKAKQSAILKQELTGYKANLRNTIGRKIDFTKVIGDGSCTVSFRIDKNGRLTNRSFTKQSSNNTLNDAVYNAVMATPSFNPPPSGYNNEILNLNISFKNGNFEISLP